MRHRIYLSVNEETYALINRIKKDYGFSSVCQMLLTLLMLFVRRVQFNESLEEVNDDIRDEIDQMFDDFESWEDTPDAVAPPHGRSKIEHSCPRTRYTRD